MRSRNVIRGMTGLVAALAIGTVEAGFITLDFETAATGRDLPTSPLLTSLGTIATSVSGGMLWTPDISSNTGMSGYSLEHQQSMEPDFAQLAFDFDVSSITFLYAGDVLGQFLAQALDASLAVVDSYFDPDTANDLPGGPVTLSGAGIRYFRFYDPDFYYGWAVVDDMTITGAVPEPTTLALFTLGLSGMGVLRRKRK